MDPARRRGMGEAARRFAQARSWQASLERVYALYRASEPARGGRACLRPGGRSSRASAREGRAMTLAITVIVCAHFEERSLPAGCLRFDPECRLGYPTNCWSSTIASTDESGAEARRGFRIMRGWSTMAAASGVVVACRNDADEGVPLETTRPR